MRVHEQHAARSQPIHVRRQRLRMALQAADPVVEIIDRDEEHVRLRSRAALNREAAKSDQRAKNLKGSNHESAATA